MIKQTNKQEKSTGERFTCLGEQRNIGQIRFVRGHQMQISNRGNHRHASRIYLLLGKWISGVEFLRI